MRVSATKSARPAYDAVIDAPFGKVGIWTESGYVVDVDFVSGRLALKPPQHAFAKRVCRVLEKYFIDPRYSLDLPLALDGSAHQRRVWQALIRIPVGEVLTYGEIAQRLRSSARAVGGACRTNPICIIVPCHRVVGASEIGGFMGQRAGSAIMVKRWLLAHEQRQ